MLEDVLEKLKSLEGLNEDFLILSEEEKNTIMGLEEENNIGVKEALSRSITIAFSHNSDFREPAEPIVAVKGKKTVFPAVKFPEIEDSVSASPGWDADAFLRKRLKKLKDDDATLLLGLDWDDDAKAKKTEKRFSERLRKQAEMFYKSPKKEYAFSYLGENKESPYQKYLDSFEEKKKERVDDSFFSEEELELLLKKDLMHLTLGTYEQMSVEEKEKFNYWKQFNGLWKDTKVKLLGMGYAHDSKGF
ncbi:hypothetical protein GF336_02205 [Candidatus Woesearchaeota archaeon]|nr:hypothetical protein [Candidatus Woesearchaeota archaeon]